MKTVRTAMRVLTLFGPDRPTLRVTHVAEAFGLSVSSASRLLSALRATGLLEQDEARCYRVGPLAYRLGVLYKSRNRLADLVAQAARRLTDETGLTCWVAVPSDSDALLISRVPGHAAHGFLVDPGGRLPAYASASGKALLARRPDDEIRALFGRRKFEPRTDRTITDLSTLLRDLAEVRRRRWSIVEDELFVGITSVGVAVGAPDEPTAMAFSLSLPSSEAGERVPAIARAVVAAAAEIGRNVGDPFWAGEPARVDEPTPETIS